MNDKIDLSEFNELMDLVDRTRRRLLTEIYISSRSNPALFSAGEKMTSEKVRELCDKADRAKEIKEKAAAEKKCREAQTRYAEGK